MDNGNELPEEYKSHVQFLPFQMDMQTIIAKLDKIIKLLEDGAPAMPSISDTNGCICRDYHPEQLGGWHCPVCGPCFSTL